MKKQIPLLLLLISVSNILFASKYSLSALFDACYWGEDEEIKEYIHNGFNVNDQDQNERTLIHCAASNGHLQIVKILINAGADLEVKDRNDATTLHYAVRFGFLDIVQYLLAEGASVQSQSMEGDTPLHNAVEFIEYKDIVKVLIDAGSDVNALDLHQSSPLDLALYHKNIEAIQMLLDAGANPFLLNKSQETIFDRLQLVNQGDELEHAVILMAFLEQMNYEKYRKKFNISHEAYVKAWHLLFSDQNRDILIQYVHKATARHPTHLFQRLLRSRECLFK